MSERVGEFSGDLVMVVFRGVGLRGDRGGRGRVGGGVLMLVWIFSGDGGGAALAVGAVARKGFMALLA